MTDYKVEEAEALKIWNKIKDADIAGSTPGITTAEVVKYMSKLSDKERKEIGGTLSYLGMIEMPITLESLTDAMKKPFTPMGFSGVMQQGDKAVYMEGVITEGMLKKDYDANHDGKVSKGEGMKAMEDIKNLGKPKTPTLEACSPINIKSDTGPRQLV